MILKKIWFTQKCKQQKSWSNKNHCHKFRIYWISSTPSITSNAVANTQNSCYLLYFLHKLKLSLVKNNCWWLRYRWQIWSYRITTLSERDLTFSSGSISLSRIYIVQKDRFFYIGELWYIDTKSGDEESILFFFCTKTQHSSILNYSAVGEWEWKRFKSNRGLSGKLLKHL